MSEADQAKKLRGPKKEEFVGLPVRQAAVHLLQKILVDRKPLDQLIGRFGSGSALSGLTHRDRAFAHAIVATSLRRLGQIDHVVTNFLDKPLPKKCGKLREILIAATAQILFLGSAPHAPINLAVRQCQLDRKTRRFDKLANAILRRIDREGRKLVDSENSYLLNTPGWLFERWEETYGPEAARYIADANLSEAVLDLTVKSDTQGWANRLNGVVLPTGTVRLNAKGRIENLAGYDEGEWWVQDAAAALPARLFGDLRERRVADICAAPGGKTAQLCMLGAEVTAVDSSAARLDRLKSNLDRLKLNAEIVEADATEWTPRNKFDAILLDSPCSATGTIRRHPDIMYLKTRNDIEELSELQFRLLDHSLNNLNAGGLLVYCTCSLEPEEGPELISKILSARDDIQLVPFDRNDKIINTDWIVDGCVRTLPFFMPMGTPELSGMDGFFIARLAKHE